jgi:hypothetical protein
MVNRTETSLPVSINRQKYVLSPTGALLIAIN